MNTVNIKNHRKSLVELPYGTRLLPGENDVPAKRWDSESANPNTQRLVDQGTIEKLPGKANPLPTEATDDERARATGRRADELAEFDIDQIKGLLADTDDVRLLEAWANDDRGEVAKLVKARIRAVKRKTK